MENEPSGNRLDPVTWWGVLATGGSIGVGAILFPFGVPLTIFTLIFGVGVLLITIGWLAART